MAEGAERDDRLRDIFKLAADRGTALLEVTRAELDRLTGGAVHQGIALQLPAFEYAHPDDLLAAALDSDREPLIVALDSITDPRNLGAIVRSAAAFGAHGVLIPERRSAGMTAAAWKTSAGRGGSHPDRSGHQPQPQLAGVRRRGAEPDRAGRSRGHRASLTCPTLGTGRAGGRQRGSWPVPAGPRGMRRSRLDPDQRRAWNPSTPEWPPASHSMKSRDIASEGWTSLGGARFSTLRSARDRHSLPRPAKPKARARRLIRAPTIRPPPPRPTAPHSPSLRQSSHGSPVPSAPS